MRAEEIALVSALARSRAGLRVAPDRPYLIESRLAPVARCEGFESIAALLATIRERREEPLIWAVAEAMAAGETSFYRDRAPFKLLVDEILPQLGKLRGGAPVRVWSAACATGQEIYSLALMAEELAEAGAQIELAASDLSRHALERAQAGLFTQFEVQRGLPIRKLAAQFEKDGDDWRISAAVRERVKWRRINLIAGLKQIGRFDVVLCRYVLGHMTEDAQRKVLDDLPFVLAADGYLLLGEKEAVVDIGPAFEPVVGRSGLFRRNPAFEAVAA